MGKKNKALNINKEELYTYYIVEKLTCEEIAKIYDCTSKSVRNYLNKFGIQIRSMGESVALERSKWSEEKELARSRKFHDTWVNTPEDDKVLIISKRIVNLHTEESNLKANIARANSKHCNISKAEDNYYKHLLYYFDKDDIQRQYLDIERYPYLCDFYIKSLDLFIEYQGHYTHYDEPYDCNNIHHSKVLELLQSKGLDMSTWTTHDVNKRTTAIYNNINLLLIYPKHKNYLITGGIIKSIDTNDIYKI